MNKLNTYINKTIQYIKFFTISVPFGIILYCLVLFLVFTQNLFKIIKNINHEYRFKSFWKRR